MHDDVASIKLIGGQLCLDFANTVDWRTTKHPVELINGFSDLVTWSRRVGTITDPEATYLLEKAAHHPGEAAEALTKAIELRETIYRIFDALEQGLEPNASEISALNRHLTEALSRLRVVPAAGGFAFDWDAYDHSLDRAIWPLARSAAELLVSGELTKLRECEGDGCGWLFIDTSKNSSRHWCSMDDCGNRAKARRHYRRQRASYAPSCR